MVKALQRSPRHKEYRDKVAHDIKELRKYGDTGRDLAKTLLEKEKQTPLYKESDTSNLRKHEIAREKRNKRIIEIMDTEDYDDVKQRIYHAIDYKRDVDVAKKLIEKGWENLIFIYTDKFRPSDEMMELFLSIDCDDVVAPNQWIVNYLFHVGQDPKVEGCLTKKSIEKFIDAGIKNRAYIANLHIFGGLDKESLFMILDNRIDIEDYYTLLYNLGNFNGLDKESFNALVSYKGYLEILEDDGRKRLYKQIDNFEGLGEEEAKLLIEKGYGHYVAEHPEKFGLKKEK